MDLVATLDILCAEHGADSPGLAQVFDEISGSISQYLDDEAITKGCTVVIAPQDDQQDEDQLTTL